MRYLAFLFIWALLAASPSTGWGIPLSELIVREGEPPPQLLVGDVTFSHFIAPEDGSAVTPLTDDPDRPGLLFESTFWAEEGEGPDPWSIAEFSLISSRRVSGLSLEIAGYRFWDPESESLIDVTAYFTDATPPYIDADLHARATSTMVINDFAEIDLGPEEWLQMYGMGVQLTVADTSPFQLESWALRVHLVPEPAGIVLAATCGLGSAVVLLLRKRGARKRPASRPKAPS